MQYGGDAARAECRQAGKPVLAARAILDRQKQTHILSSALCLFSQTYSAIQTRFLHSVSLVLAEEAVEL
jgi:hypothetical protein